jgi:small conductance mechanosensitive channel
MTVTNMTKEYSRAVLDIGVAYKENVDDVMRVMKEVGEEMSKDPEFASRIREPLEVLGIDSFGDSSVNIKARITTKPLEQWAVAREYRRRIKNRFDEIGIEIPFPHVTLYMGEGQSMGALKIRNVGDREDTGGGTL